MVLRGLGLWDEILVKKGLKLILPYRNWSGDWMFDWYL